MNGGKVGTVNEQENPPLRRTPRKINKVDYAENSKRVNKEEISDENSEVRKILLVNIFRFTYI